MVIVGCPKLAVKRRCQLSAVSFQPSAGLLPSSFARWGEGRLLAARTPVTLLVALGRPQGPPLQIGVSLFSWTFSLCFLNSGVRQRGCHPSLSVPAARNQCNKALAPRERAVGSRVAVFCSRLIVIGPAPPFRSKPLTSFAQIVLFLLLSGLNLC